MNGQDGDVGGIFARRFDASGVAQAAEFQINSYTTGGQHPHPSAVSLDADGDFVVVWHSDDQDGSDRGVFFRSFDSSGVPQTAETQVNTYTRGHQTAPAVSVADGGRLRRRLA